MGGQCILIRTLLNSDMSGLDNGNKRFWNKMHASNGQSFLKFVRLPIVWLMYSRNVRVRFTCMPLCQVKSWNNYVIQQTLLSAVQFWRPLNLHKFTNVEHFTTMRHWWSKNWLSYSLHHQSSRFFYDWQCSSILVKACLFMTPLQQCWLHL